MGVSIGLGVRWCPWHGVWDGGGVCVCVWCPIGLGKCVWVVSYRAGEVCVGGVL